MSDERVLAGRYRLRALLGSGGMADVYDAVDERLDRPVAVKVLKPALATDPQLTQRFITEARSAARLAHPSVVAVFDAGSDDGHPWLVMERLPGRTLGDELAAGQLDQRRLRTWILEVLAALGAAHRAGIIHRDIKPGNILITADGHAKVADFGIAKGVEADPGTIDLTSTGMLLGTPAYLAPERIDGLPATARSDLFAVGVVLWEALAGHKPFDGPTPMAVAARVRSEDAPRLARVRPDADRDLAAAAEAAMRRDPAQRPASAEEMAAIVDGATPTVAMAAPPPPRPAVAPTIAMVPPPPVAPALRPVPAAVVRRPPPPSSGWGAGIVAALVAFVVLIAGAAYLLTRDGGGGGTTLPTTTAVTGPSTTLKGTTTAKVTTTVSNASQKLAADLRLGAERAQDSGDAAGGDVGDDMNAIAELLDAGSAGGAARDATALRGRLPGLVADGKLSAATARDVDATVAEVPGSTAPATTAPSTTAPSTTAPTTTATSTSTSSKATTSTSVAASGPGRKGKKGG